MLAYDHTANKYTVNKLIILFVDWFGHNWCQQLKQTISV